MKIHYPDGKIIECTLEEYKEIERNNANNSGVDLTNIENTLKFILMCLEKINYCTVIVSKDKIEIPEPEQEQPQPDPQPEQEQPQPDPQPEEQPKPADNTNVSKSKGRRNRVLVMNEKFEKLFITSSIVEAQSRTGVSVPMIYRVIDKKKPCKGYVFKRYTKEDEELDNTLANIEKNKNTY